MFKPRLEFVIKADTGNSIKDILAMVAQIKKAHPNAFIRVEMEM